MAPPANSSIELDDAAYLLEVFAAMPDFKGDWSLLAARHSVHVTTPVRRFKAIAKRNGYTFENGKVTRDSSTAGSGPAEPPKKVKTKREPKMKANPTTKKRKISQGDIKEEDLEEGQSDTMTTKQESENNGDDGCGEMVDVDEV